jgi:hypothetical protein
MLLGKGGSNVSSIQEQTSCFVQFSKPGTAVNNERDRMMIIATNEIENGKEALRLLLESVAAVVRFFVGGLFSCVRRVGCIFSFFYMQAGRQA